jgi:hypothetical protein
MKLDMNKQLYILLFIKMDLYMKLDIKMDM